MQGVLAVVWEYPAQAGPHCTRTDKFTCGYDKHRKGQDRQGQRQQQQILGRPRNKNRGAGPTSGANTWKKAGQVL